MSVGATQAEHLPPPSPTFSSFFTVAGVSVGCVAAFLTLAVGQGPASDGTTGPSSALRFWAVVTVQLTAAGPVYQSTRPDAVRLLKTL